MKPRTWFRVRRRRQSPDGSGDARSSLGPEIPNFWAFLIHVSGEPVSWSGIAKLATLAMTLVLSLVLVIGAAGWALHEAPLTGRADHWTTAGAVAGLVGAFVAALKARFLHRRVLRTLSVRDVVVTDAAAAPRLQLVDRGVA